MSEAAVTNRTHRCPTLPGVAPLMRFASWIAPFAVLVLCVLLWEAAVRLFKIPVYMLPPPSAIIQEMVEKRQFFMGHALHTSAAIVLGFIFAVLVGVPMATLMVYSARVSRLIQPMLITAQVLPKVALAPLFIVWFGFGLMPKVVMTFLIAFFPVVIDTLTGLLAVRPGSLMLIRSMGGSRWQSFWKVRLPTALPSMFAGFKVAMTFAVVGAIVAEFVAADSGLGYVLVEARGTLNMVTVFASITWLVLLGFAFYYIVEGLERVLMKGRRHGAAHELGAGM